MWCSVIYRYASYILRWSTFCALPSFGAVATFSSHTTFSSHKVSVKGSDIDSDIVVKC